MLVSSAHHAFLVDTCHISTIIKTFLVQKVFWRPAQRKPDLAPDCLVAHRASPTDPPNWHSVYQFGGLARMARRPAGPPGAWPGLAGLTAGLAGLYKFVGRVPLAVFPHFPPSPRPPPTPLPPPLQAPPPPSLSTQPIPSKFRSGVDRGGLKLSSEDLRISSTTLGDRDFSPSSCAPCLRVTSSFFSPSSSPCLTLRLFMLLYE
jgi:hypothetical protein